MRIVVASAYVPFGDRDGHADELAGRLRAAGHVVEQIWLPVDSDPARHVERELTVALTDVSDAGDMLIAVRPPAHLLRHPRKVVWLQDSERADGSARWLTNAPPEIAALLG
ncbi:MAG TPA: hypothetical protein VGG07_21135 [Solirubrobacteraceae bacterium]